MTQDQIFEEQIRKLLQQAKACLEEAQAYAKQISNHHLRAKLQSAIQEFEA